MRVYLSMAIDRNDKKHDMLQTTLNNITLWADNREQNVVVFCPQSAFHLVRQTNNEQDLDYLVRMNKVALLQAQAMLVIYTPGVESWGVPFELFSAYDRSTPTSIVMPAECVHLGKIAADRLPVYLVHHLNGTLEISVWDALDSLLSQVQAKELDVEVSQ